MRFTPFILPSFTDEQSCSFLALTICCLCVLISKTEKTLLLNKQCSLQLHLTQYTGVVHWNKKLLLTQLWAPSHVLQSCKWRHMQTNDDLTPTSLIFNSVSINSIGSRCCKVVVCVGTAVQYTKVMKGGLKHMETRTTR